MTDTPIGRAQLAAVLPCTDFERCTAFYRDTLGLRVEGMPDMPGNAMVYGGGGTTFALYRRDEPTRAEHTVAGIMVDDFDAAIGYLRSSGVRLEDYDQPGLKTENGIATYGEFRSAWFKDTEGNILSIVPSMEAARKAA